MIAISGLLKWFLKFRNDDISFGVGVMLEPAHLARGGKILVADGVTIRLGTIMMPAGGWIEIGPYTSINHYCVFHGGGGLSIGARCLIAPRVSIFAANHVYCDRNIPISEQGMSSKGGVHIADDVWIGTGAIILDGVRVGQGAVIGAGSVVTRDVAPYAVVAGNPAKVIAMR